MHKQKLTDVPKHILAKPEVAADEDVWTTDYNIAAWFRFENVTYESVKLNLMWRDAQGFHSECVDQLKITSASLLLSGIARITVNGAIQDMAVIVETNNTDYTVDELFVQPARHPGDSIQAI